MRLTSQEAVRRLGAARVLRLATVGPGGAPHLVPATFAWSAGPGAGRIAIAVDHKPKRQQNLRRLSNIAARPEVCVLADEYSDDWTRLWWVRADGAARVLAPGPGAGTVPGGDETSDVREHVRALDLLAAKYPQYAARRQDGPVIVVDVERVTGWAYTDPPADEDAV
jgi:PPOX class probable F420-dependent enzyme